MTGGTVCLQSSQKGPPTHKLEQPNPGALDWVTQDAGEIEARRRGAWDPQSLSIQAIITPRKAYHTLNCRHDQLHALAQGPINDQFATYK